MTDSFPDRSREIPRVLARVRPGHELQSVVQLGEGTDHVAYEVNWDLIVRFVVDPTRRAEQVRAEAGVLDVVKTLAPPAVPDPLLVLPDDGILVYGKIGGAPLLHRREDLPRLDLARFGAVIGQFLSRLHHAPASDFEAFASSDRRPPGEWLVEARLNYDQVIDSVPATRRAPIGAFFAQSPPGNPQSTAFCHNDLGIEHVLVDPATLAVTGIIDWADAAITDPACDLALIYRDLGPAALAGVLDHYAGPGEPVEHIHERAAFYARCSVFGDIAYGLLPGHDLYLAQSRAALDWLFPL